MKSGYKLWILPVAILAMATAIKAEEQARTEMTRPSVSNAADAVKSFCDKQCENFDKISHKIDDARKSGDKAQMRTALDAAYNEIQEEKTKTDRASKRAIALRERLESTKGYLNKVKEDNAKLENTLYYNDTSEFIISP